MRYYENQALASAEGEVIETSLFLYGDDGYFELPAWLKTIIGIILVVLSAIVIVVGYVHFDRIDSEIAYETMAQLANTANIKEDVANDKSSTTANEKKDPYMQTVIDFKKLKDLNPDIYAYIIVPGTEINYPILQDQENDDHYLYFTAEQRKGYPGSIYTESKSGQDFTVFNTVIYGHNMRNGTMFAGLHKYEDASFLKAHPYIYIYTEKKTMRYHIYEVSAVQDYHLSNAFNGYDDTSDRTKFLKFIRNGMINMSKNMQEPSEDDVLVTLSTCIGSREQNRLVLLGVQDKVAVKKTTSQKVEVD